MKRKVLGTIACLIITFALSANVAFASDAATTAYQPCSASTQANAYGNENPPLRPTPRWPIWK